MVRVCCIPLILLNLASTLRNQPCPQANIPIFFPNIEILGGASRWSMQLHCYSVGKGLWLGVSQALVSSVPIHVYDNNGDWMLGQE